MSGDRDYRIELLVAVGRLNRLDKVKFSREEREKAAKIRAERTAEELTLVCRHQLVTLKKLQQNITIILFKFVVTLLLLFFAYQQKAAGFKHCTKLGKTALLLLLLV